MGGKIVFKSKRKHALHDSSRGEVVSVAMVPESSDEEGPLAIEALRKDEFSRGEEVLPTNIGKGFPLAEGDVPPAYKETRKI